MITRIGAPSALRRRLGAALCYRVLCASGITALGRQLRRAGPVLCYHNVVTREDARAGDPGLHIDVGRFVRQVDWLAAHYEILPLADFVERLAAGTSPRSAAAITFDDAYAGVFEHAVPFLRSRGIPATIFVVSEAPGRSSGFWWDHPTVVEALTPARRQQWLHRLQGDGPTILSHAGVHAAAAPPPTHRPAGWTTIRANAGGLIDIAVHSATHRSLPTLSDEDLEQEVVGSRAALYRATGVEAQFFAYPYGMSDDRVRARVRRAGYRAAFGLSATATRDPADLWCLDRVNVPGGIGDAAFEAWLSGVRMRGRSS